MRLNITTKSRILLRNLAANGSTSPSDSPSIVLFPLKTKKSKGNKDKNYQKKKKKKQTNKKQTQKQQPNKSEFIFKKILNFSEGASPNSPYLFTFPFIY